MHQPFTKLLYALPNLTTRAYFLLYYAVLYYTLLLLIHFTKEEIGTWK